MSFHTASTKGRHMSFVE